MFSAFVIICWHLPAGKPLLTVTEGLRKLNREELRLEGKLVVATVWLLTQFPLPFLISRTQIVFYVTSVLS